MAWSTSAPTLPSGSSWTGSTSISQIIRNHIKLDCTLSIARLEGNNVAVKCHFTIKWGSYGDYYVATLYLKEGGSAADTSITTPDTVYSAGTTMDVYWTGEKAAGASVSITVGLNNDSASQRTKTLTAPALLALPIWVDDGGTLKQVEKAYYNDNGTIKECAVYYNDNGTIKEIK